MYLVLLPSLKISSSFPLDRLFISIFIYIFTIEIFMCEIYVERYHRLCKIKKQTGVFLHELALKSLSL